MATVIQKPNIYKQKLLFFAACLLFLSLVLHTMGVSHHHPPFLGEGVQALAHGQDEKWLLLLAVMFVWAVVEDFGQALFVWLLNLSRDFLRQNYYRLRVIKLSNYLLLFLRQGLLEPKPF